MFLDSGSRLRLARNDTALPVPIFLAEGGERGGASLRARVFVAEDFAENRLGADEVFAGAGDVVRAADGDEHAGEVPEVDGDRGMLLPPRLFAYC